MRRYVITVLALIICSQVFAQQFTVSGVVRDQQAGAALQKATVRLYSTSDPAFSRSTITDSTGHFLFQNLMRDSFLLYVSYTGYKEISQPVKIDTANVQIDINASPSSSSELATVVIKLNVPAFTQKGDTLQISADQFKVNPDATAEDLAKKVPGITIENGQVKAQGEVVRKVTLDGRDLFGDDATAALRNLPAEIVDKIQIFDRMSDQAQLSGIDDGNTTKSINIITRANMRNGQFGRVFAGYGTDDSYAAGGNATILKDNRRISIVGNFNNVNQQNFSQQDLLGVTSSGGNRGGNFRGGGDGGRGGGAPRGGGGNFGGFGGGSGNFLVGSQNGINKTNALGINYSDIWGKKLTVSGSYFFNDTKNNTYQLANTRYFTSEITSLIDTTTSESNNSNHRLNLRLDYRIDSMNQLIITPNVNLQHNVSDRYTGTSTFFTANNPYNQTLNTNINNEDRRATSLGNSIIYRHSFPKRGRVFSINLNTSYNKRSGDAFVDIFNRSLAPSGPKDTSTNRYTDQLNNTTQISGNITYSEPLSENSQLQFSYNPRVSKSKADQNVFGYNSFTNGYTNFQPNLSNVLDNTTTAQNGGLSYRWGDRDRMVSFGVNLQSTNLKSEQTFPVVVSVNKTFTNFLPNAMFRYKLSPRSNVRLFYRANVNEPSVTQLQNVIDISSAPVYSIGNVNLKTQYTQFGSFQYTYTNPVKNLVFVTNLFYQTANDYVANVTTAVGRDTVVAGEKLLAGSRLSAPVNLDGYRNMRTSFTFGMPLKFIKSNFNVSTMITHANIPGITNGRLNETQNTTFTVGSTLGSNISQYVDFTVSYSANFNKVRNEVLPSANNDYFQHNAGLQLNLLSKSGWFFQNDLTNQFYNGLSAGFNQSYTLWNMGVGKKFLAGQKGELKFTVFDLLKQNQSISRTSNGDYIRDEQNKVLQQYFMLTFTYNLRNFGTAAQRNQMRDERRNWMGDR